MPGDLRGSLFRKWGQWDYEWHSPEVLGSDRSCSSVLVDLAECESDYIYGRRASHYCRVHGMACYWVGKAANRSRQEN